MRSKLDRFKVYERFRRLDEIIPLTNEAYCDVGCGFGWATLWFARSGASFAIGFDLSRERIVGALNNSKRTRIQADFIQADACFLPLRTGSVYCVFSQECIEHIPNWKQAISEMKRLSNNAVILTTPSASNPLWKLGKSFVNPSKYAEKMKAADHEHIFKASEMRKELAENDTRRVKFASLMFLGYPGELVPRLSSRQLEKIYLSIVAPFDFYLCHLYPFNFLGTQMIVKLA